MEQQWIDLRSDTVTRPSEGMLRAMMQARVGDDVFGEDPTVTELEQTLAGMFGMEAGIFTPSGTMANQIAIKLHTRPGDEVICDETAHVYLFEAGGIAFNSGCSVRLLKGDRGRFTREQVEEALNAPDNYHLPQSRLVVAENTSNKGGGSVWSLNELQRISDFTRKKGLAFHLDGARLFNAMAWNGTQPGDYGSLFDTISICLSKGLGTPVGSVLLGNREAISKARRIRKVLGGGMRQAGYLAAAGLYALQHNIPLLKEDLRRAQTLASVIQQLPYVEEVLPVESNILIFRLNNSMPAERFLDLLKSHNILALTFGPQTLRFVTHLDFTDEMLEKVLRVLEEIQP
ncbi:MAG: threonine aldolase family protein [Bacteroidales bacterium]